MVVGCLLPCIWARWRGQGKCGLKAKSDPVLRYSQENSSLLSQNAVSDDAIPIMQSTIFVQLGLHRNKFASNNMEKRNTVYKQYVPMLIGNYYIYLYHLFILFERKEQKYRIGFDIQVLRLTQDLDSCQTFTVLPLCSLLTNEPWISW